MTQPTPKPRAKISNKEACNILKKIPCTRRKFRLKLAENESGLKVAQIENPGATIEDIRDYNLRTEGWEDGYAQAMAEITEWRNQEYLRIKGLL